MPGGVDREEANSCPTRKVMTEGSKAFQALPIERRNSGMFAGTAILGVNPQGDTDGGSTLEDEGTA